MQISNKKIAYLSILIAGFFHFIFLMIFKNNSMIQDESRIVGDFFLEYFKTDSAIQKFKLVFFKENESYPGLIRFLYLISYYATGSIQFKWVLLLGNLLNFIPIYIIFKYFQTQKINLIYFLPIPFLVFNLISYMTFSFSYVSFFYIGSSCIPLVCIYLLVYNYPNWGYYFFLLSLLLFSSTIVPTLFILILISLFQRNFKHIIVLVLFAVLYLIIAKLNSNSANNEAYNQKIFFDFIQNPVKIIALFYMTLGAWAKFFTNNLNVFGVFGILTFLVTSIHLIKTFKNEGISKKFIFHASIFLFFYALLFVNIVFRWYGNYEYQKNSIQDGSKVYFIIIIALFVYLQFLEITAKLNFRWIYIFITFVIISNYFITYYQAIGYAVLHYKSTMLSNINCKFENDHIFDRNQTNPDKYKKLIDGGYIKVEKNVFSENWAQINKAIARTKNFNNKLNLEQKITEQGGINMYGDRPTPTIFYSYNSPTVGKFYKRMDGLYLIFSSAKDTAIFPVIFNQFIYWQLLLLRPTNIYDTQFFITLNNAFGFDLPQKEYLIHFCYVEDGKITKIEQIGKKLILENKKQFLANL